MAWRHGSWSEQWAGRHAKNKERDGKRERRSGGGGERRKPEWECGRCAKRNYMDRDCCRACGYRGPDLSGVSAQGPSPSQAVADSGTVKEAEAALAAAKAARMGQGIIEQMEEHLAGLRAARAGTTELEKARARLLRAEQGVTRGTANLATATTEHAASLSERVAAETGVADALAKVRAEPVDSSPDGNDAHTDLDDLISAVRDAGAAGGGASGAPGSPGGLLSSGSPLATALAKAEEARARSRSGSRTPRLTGFARPVGPAGRQTGQPPQRVEEETQVDPLRLDWMGLRAQMVEAGADTEMLAEAEGDFTTALQETWTRVVRRRRGPTTPTTT